ncbi:MAG: LLM class flavin-dependent oxidoreductase, partial [Dehalococcoidia bacterium]|nr:LLM class flavin-dependent oxidoreductase [Dehalococcoidia bacterium]
MAIFGRFLERVYQDPKRDGYQRGTTDLENSNSQFDPKVGAELYHRYLDEHVMADELGFDAIMLNEHHQSAFCMGAQPNVESSILARVTKNIRIVMAGNVLPIWDNPLLLAEQIAMISQISRGRLVNGWVRGGGREHIANTAQTPYNWERFKEAHALIRKSWEVPGPWRWEGEHFNYRNVNPWARPYQTPMPQWQAGVISRNTLEWA